MIIIIVTLLVVYFIISIIVGIFDVIALKKQNDTLFRIVNSDIEAFKAQKKIIDIHNIIFLPSLIPIMIAIYPRK